ncbi:EAL domain-containing protein [Thalassomonas actiniarum]|uniref:EAL domain-containing protein n=1 Tax=Thalassomonas actiniarum TaxID=485447 RepID=A0AAE9YTL4_9GAMM|nr:EAL domain-containing protein [Thalassomonas actiniarum]WDE00573.1 EAL domain-containing protein [Thalassomonas actiniarum]
MLLSFFRHLPSFFSNVISFAIISLLLLATLIAPASALQADVQLKFKQYSTEHGLSQNSVFSIAQDKNGFLWFATEDGLNRFDGHDFSQYRYSATDPHSIADNLIRKVFVDQHNTLWVGTQNGLSRYNAEQDNFDNFFNITGDNQSLKDNLIWDIYQKQPNKNNQEIDNPLWVSTATGIHQFNPENNSFTRIRIQGFEDRFKEIKRIFQDDRGNYWLGSFSQGLYWINSNLSYAIAIHKDNKWNLNLNASALFDIKIIDDQYWLATNNGVYIISYDFQILEHFNSTSENPTLSNEIRAIEQVSETQVWLATNKGLNSLNLSNNKLTAYQNNSNKFSLSENWLMDIFKDNSGNVWLGTYGGGVNQYNPLKNSFYPGLDNKNLWVESIGSTSDDIIWFATEQGDLYYLKNENSIEKHSVSLGKDITHLITDSSDLWLRTVDEHLYKLDTSNSLISEHKSWFKNAKHSSEKRLAFLNKHIWYINTDSLLASYNTQTQEFTHFQPNNNSSLSSLQVIDNGRIVVTSAAGEIFYFHPQDNNFTQVKFNKPANFSIAHTSNIASSQQWLWLGSKSQGIALINQNTKASTVFNENNQLSNNFISDILIDENNNAWLATNKSISVINPDTGLVRNFDHDFFASNNDFIQFSALKSSTGLLYFGSTNGYISFNPKELLKVTPRIEKPFFTDVFIANKKIDITQNSLEHEHSHNTGSKPNSTLNKQLNTVDVLRLQHYQSPVSIDFVAPNAKLPSQLKYRYRLFGLDEDWIETDDNNRRATYTNLSAGEYNFEVQAYDLQDTSLTQTNNLKILVLPPWWLSRWAMLVYSLIALSCIGYVVLQMRHKRKYHMQIKLSEERLKLSLWGSGDEMWDWNIKTGKIFRSNIWGLLEFPQDGQRNASSSSNIGKGKNNANQSKSPSENTNIHQQDIPRVKAALEAHFEDKTEHFESTYRVRDKEGNWIWVLDRGKIVERDDKGIATRMTGTLKDISQIKKAEERLKLFAKCIANISDAVVIYDREFVILDVNKAFLRITGKSREKMVGRSLRFPRYPTSFSTNIKKHLLTKGSWHGEVENTRQDNSVFLADFNIDVIRDENQCISNFVAVFSDISQRKETEAELRKLANTDTLTGLPNRSYFQANQLQLVKNKTPHALLVFDLDNFKKINDSMGHQVGDVLLCKVAERMVNASRKQDTVYRLGGDEFSIIIEETNDIHTITTIAKNILDTIALPLKLKNQEIVLYSSIGIVLYPEDGATPQELLKNADTAMYHAKGLGGNKYQFFNESMNKKAVTRLQIESLIRHGLKKDLFSVYYQPKIEISTGKIAGMEALVRFETPTKGLISPVVFIPVSEETGQIIDIGEVVLRKACFATKQWVDAGLFDGRIAVNLSAVQFTQPNLVTLIANVLEESQLPARYLELEITEGTVMDSPQKAIETMLQIRALGVHLALDDFGTGYSSLAYLKKFPLNTLKIDKAFVDDIEQSEQGRNMVATIVTIAHNLRMQVVAEGVETNQQLEFLAKLKCEQLQGYLYSKPLSTGDFEKYLVSYQITDKSTSFA